MEVRVFSTAPSSPEGPPASPRGPSRFEVRAARDRDADQLIGLIGGCWAEYPGSLLAVDAEVPELRAIATHYAARDGRFWVVELDGRIAGCVGVEPAATPGVQELCRLYVGKTHRRHGLGARLVDLAEDEARRRGASAIELWSDTRFQDAHRLYERLGYVRQPRTRRLDDLSATVEFHYLKTFAG